MTGYSPGRMSERTQLMELAGQSDSVTISKLVSKGERLEIDAGGDIIKLDSLLLEGLAWQRTADGLCDIVADPDAVTGDPVATFVIDGPGDGNHHTIASEYSSVNVSKTQSDVGNGLKIVAPGRGNGSVLGTATLCELAKIDDTFVFSEWFETPFGPEDTPTEGAI